MAYKVEVGEVVVHVPDGSRVTLTCRNCSGILEESRTKTPGYDARDRVELAARRAVAAMRRVAAGDGGRFGVELDELAAAVDALADPSGIVPRHVEGDPRCGCGSFATIVLCASCAFPPAVR